MSVRKRTRLLLILIFPLSIGLQTCLVEPGLLALQNWLANASSHTEHGSEHNAPTHEHDRSGNEADYCCDNVFYPALRGDIFQAGVMLNPPPVLPETGLALVAPETIRPLIPDFDVPQNSARSRDKYALTCLLHAPPIFSA